MHETGISTALRLTGSHDWDIYYRGMTTPYATSGRIASAAVQRVGERYKLLFTFDPINQTHIYTF